jgi:U11/U12 small nuclear ribonucleoprotein SNRNP65
MLFDRYAEMRAIPRFESWTPGHPSCKVFVKNLARKTTEEDLNFIFGRYDLSRMVTKEQNGMSTRQDADNHEESASSNPGVGRGVSVRLMSGKMKGQAFVTFDSIEMAQKAMDEVVGFLLHDRPIVLVRASRSL